MGLGGERESAAPRRELDPIAEAIGELRADVRHLVAQVDKIEQRLWWVIGLLVAALLGVVWRR